MIEFDEIKDSVKWVCVALAVMCGLIATKDASCLWFLLIGCFL